MYAMKDLYKKRKSYSTSLRVALPSFLTIILFITATFFIILPALEKSFLARKHEMIKELTEAAWSIIASYEEKEKKGQLSRQEAQNKALEQIKVLRYGPERKDYFWINDMHPRMIMHPYRSDLDGKDVSSFQDPNGKHLFSEFVRVVKEQGQGYVDYMWQWKDDPNKIVPKLSFIKGFTPWEWIIGSGIYIEDVYVELALIRGKLTIISAIILIIITVLALYIIRQTIFADEHRQSLWNERENFLQALKDNKEKFQALVETTSDWIWEVDNNSKYTYSSPKIKELLGFTPTEIIGKTPFQFMPKKQAEPSANIFKDLLQSGKSFKSFEYTWITKNGLPITIEKNGVPIFDNQNKIIGYRGIARDISERKIAEEALKKSHFLLSRNLDETVSSLSSTTEHRDPYTAGHQQRVDILACAIAEELGMDEEQIKGLHIAAVLHDIGKIALPSEYLAKPTSLSNEERAIIKCHTEVGYEILKNIHFPWPVAEIVYQHHELLDGTGYPRGITDKEILLEAKILTVADIVEAMSSHRPYRPSLGLEAAFAEIRSGRGTKYQKETVDACMSLITNNKIEVFYEVN